MTPVEDPSLQQGSGGEAPAMVTQEVTNEDGTVSTITVPQTSQQTCIHTAEYMSQPDIDVIIEQQRNEMAAASAAAQAAAAPLPATEGEAPAAE